MVGKDSLSKYLVMEYISKEIIIGNIYRPPKYLNEHYLTLEKVLLDPIFMILKCEYFYSLWIVL